MVMSIFLRRRQYERLTLVFFSINVPHCTFSKVFFSYLIVSKPLISSHCFNCFIMTRGEGGITNHFMMAKYSKYFFRNVNSFDFNLCVTAVHLLLSMTLHAYFMIIACQLMHNDSDKSI